MPLQKYSAHLAAQIQNRPAELVASNMWISVVWYESMLSTDPHQKPCPLHIDFLIYELWAQKTVEEESNPSATGSTLPSKLDWIFHSAICLEMVDIFNYLKIILSFYCEKIEPKLCFFHSKRGNKILFFRWYVLSPCVMQPWWWSYPFEQQIWWLELILDKTVRILNQLPMILFHGDENCCGTFHLYC